MNFCSTAPVPSGGRLPCSANRSKLSLPLAFQISLTQVTTIDLMSLYLNGNRHQQGLINSHGPSCSTSNHLTPFEKQASLIPEKRKFHYKSAEDLANAITSFGGCDTAGQHFLYFDGINGKVFEVLEAELPKVQRRSTVRFTFEAVFPAAQSVRLRGRTGQTTTYSRSF